jgi:hypothetical protein
MRNVLRLFVLIGVCLALPYDFAAACGGPWIPPWRPSLYNPALSVEPGTKTVPSDDAFTVENIADWMAFIPGTDEADIRALVYESSPENLQRLLDGCNKAEEVVGLTPSGKAEDWVCRTKNAAVPEYLLFAKECEAWRGVAAVRATVDEVWTYRKTDTEEGLRLAVLAERRMLAAPSEFLRLRYAFQALRLYHGLRFYDRAVALFRGQVEGADAQAVAKDWCRAWYAGSLYFSRDYPAAFREAAAARHSRAYADAMVLTASWALEKDPESSDTALQLCRTPRERLDVLAMACQAKSNSAAAVILLREIAAAGLAVDPQLLDVLGDIVAGAQGPYAELEYDSSYKSMDAYLKDLEAGFALLRDAKLFPQPARPALMAANLAFLRRDLPSVRAWLDLAEPHVADPETGLQLFVLRLALLGAAPGVGENDAGIAVKLRLLRFFAGYAETAPKPEELSPADAALLRRVTEAGGPAEGWREFLGASGREILGGVFSEGFAKSGRAYLGAACLPAGYLFGKDEVAWSWDYYFDSTAAGVAAAGMEPEQIARLRKMIERPTGPLEVLLTSSPFIWKREELVDMEGARYAAHQNFAAAARLLDRERRGGGKYWADAPARATWTTEPSFFLESAREPDAFGHEISLAEGPAAEDAKGEHVAAAVVNTSGREQSGTPPRSFDAELLLRPVGVWDLRLPQAYVNVAVTAAPTPMVWDLAGRRVRSSDGGPTDGVNPQNASPLTPAQFAVNRKITERCLWVLSQNAADTRARAEHMLALDWLIRVGDAYDVELADRARYIQAKYVFSFHASPAQDILRRYDWANNAPPSFNPAYDRFLAVAHGTKDRELAARALFMAAFCRQTGYFEYIYRSGGHVGAGWSSDPYFRDNPPFTEMHVKYRDTEFYKNAVNACTYLRDFVSLQK